MRMQSEHRDTGSQQLATDPLGEGTTTMNDRELRKEFVRVDQTQKRVQVLVRKIRWHGPHTPVSTWEIAKSLPDTASKPTIEKATAGILQDRRYFRVCLECGERNPVGWMRDESICQGCGQVNHGIVY
jgi:hypothetical protein